ncbi:MAG: hypothetical protein EAZ33_16335 [Oscillatoriales cyanobacterium]|nr:MAG: hypothetical protein EAZ33_16335 [Oscillatoriales cyanobacterium]
MSFVICHLSFVICHLSFVICHLSFETTVNCQLSTKRAGTGALPLQLSTVNCQLSTVNCQLCQLSTVIRIYSGLSSVAHFRSESGTGRMPVPQEWQ